MPTLYIKNMVCNRCILVVKQELDKLQLKTQSVILGEVALENTPTAKQLQQLDERLSSLGFEILDDAKQQLIEKIKTIILERTRDGIENKQYNFSEILSKQLHKDYSSLSKLFSEVAGITIEQYIIQQKIEKAKELIIYDELNISEIAFRLGYSSTAHLSAQFKKVTGMTPSDFKKLGNSERKPLDKL